MISRKLIYKVFTCIITMQSININNFVVNYYENDITIGKQISLGRLWGSEHKDLFKKYYRPKTNILDIGGFIGTVSLVLSEIIDDNCKIHVFEPQYFDCLFKNIHDNHLENTIVPYKCGLSNVNGFLKANNIDINRQGNYGGQHLTTLHSKSITDQLVSKQENTIELKKLDDFNITNIGLIKLDVEGFELLVLKGGSQTLIKNNFPPIFIEIWDAVCWRSKDNAKDYYEKNKKDIIQYLTSLGYKQVWNERCDYIFAHD